MQTIEIVRGHNTTIVFFNGERVIDAPVEHHPVLTGKTFMRRGYPGRGRRVNRTAKHNAGRKVKTLRDHREGR